MKKSKKLKIQENISVSCCLFLPFYRYCRSQLVKMDTVKLMKGKLLFSQMECGWA